MSDNSWATKYLAPALGTFIANVMWVTPIKVMRDARLSGELGNINPIPFNVVVINCFAYTMYSILRQDYFIFFSNCFGIIIGTSCCLTALILLSKESPSKFESGLRTTVEYLFIGTLAFWLLILLFVGLVLDGGGASSSLVGTIAVIVSIAYYAAPLSTMARVVRKKDASSLYLPLVLVNLVNAVLWFIYGLAGINDIYVWLPNALGIALALAQVGLVLWYGGGCVAAQQKSEGEEKGPAVGVTRFSSYWVPKEEEKPLTRFQSLSRAVSSFFRPAPSQDAHMHQQREGVEGDEDDDNPVQPHGVGGVSGLTDKGGMGATELKEDTTGDAEVTRRPLEFGISGADSLGSSDPSTAHKV